MFYAFGTRIPEEKATYLYYFVGFFFFDLNETSELFYLGEAPRKIYIF